MITRATLPRMFAAAGVIAACGVGCRQLVGIHDELVFQGTSSSTSASSAGGTCNAVAFTTGDCQACSEASCCAEAAACAADQACSSFAQCLGRCGGADETCASDCRSDHADGDGPLAAALRSCQGSACATACGFLCGGYVYGGDPCATCSRQNCCDKAAACATDSTCAMLAACERQCSPTDGDCLLLCELTYPAGVDEERALGACTAGSCPTACFTSQWACLANPATPAPAVIAATFTFHDYTSLAPIVGAQARVCDLSDELCTSTGSTPIATDSRGSVTVQIDGTSQYVEIIAPTYVPFLVFLPGLSQDVSFAPPVPSQEEFNAILASLLPPGTDASKTGTVVAEAFDCGQRAAGGVALTIAPSAGTVPFYFADGVVSPGATSTDSVFGAGGFAGTVTVLGLQVGGRVVENQLTSPALTVFTRPGGLSFGLLYANPP